MLILALYPNLLNVSFGFKFKEWKWDQIKSINYLKRGFTGTLILNTVNGKVKIGVHRADAEFDGEILRKLKREAK